MTACVEEIRVCRNAASFHGFGVKNAILVGNSLIVLGMGDEAGRGLRGDVKFVGVQAHGLVCRMLAKEILRLPAWTRESSIMLMTGYRRIWKSGRELWRSTGSDEEELPMSK